MSTALHQYLCIFVICFISTTHGYLQKRASPSVRTLNIPLTIDANRRYVVGVNMSSGPNQQSLGLALATSTGYTSVAGVGCASCNDVATYNQTASTSAKPVVGAQAGAASAYQFFNGSVSGNVVKEDCALHERNGSSWAYPNQTIIVANVSTASFSSQSSGVIGLGTNANAGNFSDTIYGGFFSRNPSQTNFTFGMALNAPVASSSDGGALHWLAPDPNAYQGQLTWADVLKANSSDTINSDWAVQIDGWTFSSGSNSSSISQTAPAIVDPYYPDIYLPLSQAQTIYAGVGGASSQSSSTSNTESWIVPCSATMSFVVKINSFSVSLDENDLIVQNGSVCTGAIQGWTDPNVVQSILGAAMLNQLYLVFLVTSSGQKSLGFGSRTAEKAVSGGTIAAIVLGCLIAFAVLVGGSFLLYRRKVKRGTAWYSSKKDGPARVPGALRAVASSYDVLSSVGTSTANEANTPLDATFHRLEHSRSMASENTATTPTDDLYYDDPSRHTHAGDTLNMSVERNPDYVSSRYTPSVDLVHSPPIQATSQSFLLEPYVSQPEQSGGVLSAYDEKRRLRLQAAGTTTNLPSSSRLSTTAVIDELSDMAEPPQYEP